MTNLLGCTAGFCSSREKCANYLQGEISEDLRLCREDENMMLVKEAPLHLKHSEKAQWVPGIGVVYEGEKK